MRILLCSRSGCLTFTMWHLDTQRMNIVYCLVQCEWREREERERREGREERERREGGGRVTI